MLISTMNFCPFFLTPHNSNSALILQGWGSLKKFPDFLLFRFLWISGINDSKLFPRSSFLSYPNAFSASLFTDATQPTLLTIIVGSGADSKRGWDLLLLPFEMRGWFPVFAETRVFFNFIFQH